MCSVEISRLRINAFLPSEVVWKRTFHHFLITYFPVAVQLVSTLEWDRLRELSPFIQEIWRFVNLSCCRWCLLISNFCSSDNKSFIWLFTVTPPPPPLLELDLWPSITFLLFNVWDLLSTNSSFWGICDTKQALSSGYRFITIHHHTHCVISSYSIKSVSRH